MLRSWSVVPEGPECFELALQAACSQVHPYVDALSATVVAANFVFRVKRLAFPTTGFTNCLRIKVGDVQGIYSLSAPLYDMTYSGLGLHMPEVVSIACERRLASFSSGGMAVIE